MTGNTHVTEGLTQWICSESHDRLPAAVREKTVDVIYDSVGAMAACSILPEVKAIVELIELQGGRPECTIIGHRATLGDQCGHGKRRHGTR